MIAVSRDGGLFGLFLLVLGVVMVCWAHRLVGLGPIPATDPHTVRRFGVVATIGGGLLFFFYLIASPQG